MEYVLLFIKLDTSEWQIILSSVLNMFAHSFFIATLVICFCLCKGYTQATSF